MEWLIPALAITFLASVAMFIYALVRARPTSGGQRRGTADGANAGERVNTNDLRFGTLSRGGSPLHIPPNWAPPDPKPVDLGQSAATQQPQREPIAAPQGVATAPPGGFIAPVVNPPIAPHPVPDPPLNPILVMPENPNPTPEIPAPADIYSFQPLPVHTPADNSAGTVPVSAPEVTEAEIPPDPGAPVPPFPTSPGLPEYFPPPPEPAPIAIREVIPVAERDDDATVYEKRAEIAEPVFGAEGDLPTISPIPPYFEVLSGQYETVGRRILLFTQGGSNTFFFRRAPDRQERYPPNLILLRSVQISRDPNAHGEFVYERQGGIERCIVRNFGTYERKANPVFVRGRLLGYGEEAELAEGDVLAIGDVQLKYHARAGSSASAGGSRE
jgi:hypothetical protein